MSMNIHVQYCDIMRFTVLHNRDHKVSQSVAFFMHCKAITILLRIRVRGHFVMSITENCESHYVTVLDNPPFQWINDEVPREPESFLFAYRHEAMSDLIYLLGHLVDVKGKILVPGINDNVAPLTDGERATYTDIDFDKVHFVTIIESKMLLRASFSCWDSFSHRRTTTVPHLPKFSPFWTNWNNLLVQFVEAFQLRLWEGGGFCDFVPNQWSSTNK